MSLYTLIFAIVFAITPKDALFVPQVLLEVEKSSIGMVINPGQYLYLRVLSDGHYEMEKYDQTGKKVIQKKVLSAQKLAQLKVLLDQKDIKALKEKYSGAPTLDHHDDTFIKINRVTGIQQILVLSNLSSCRKDLFL